MILCAGCAAVAIAGVGVCLLAGCSSPMAKLEGERGHTQWITGAEGPVVEVPSVFVLRNRTWGTVRIESMRTDVGTECSTIPPLPAAISGGKSIEVAVIARFPVAAGDGSRKVFLEKSGEPPLVLSIDGRFQPAAPSGGTQPQPVSGP